MRAKDLKFKDLIKADEAKGTLSLGESRVVLIEADALGKLRKELVDNLGINNAKGILLRYGYRCGHADALRLRDRYPWRSEMEWLLAGPKMHALEGVVKVEVDATHIDRQQKIFSVRGRWIDSFEAEQHLKLFGRSDRAVCWSLTGYASGYASAFFGDAVCCVETHCIGRDDDMCRFELKRTEEWGPEAEDYKRALEHEHFQLRFDNCLECVGALSSQIMEVTESRGYLENILKNSPEAIITTDANGRISFYSRGAETSYGYRAEEAHGQSIALLYAGGARETDMLMAALKEKGHIQSYDTAFLAKNGTLIPAQASISLVRDRLGKVIGLLHIVRDLREARRLAFDLERRDAFLAHILLDSADAIITLDAQDRVISWNKGAEAMFSYSEKEISGKSIEILVPPELKESQELAKLSGYVRRDGIVSNYQTERLTKAGHRITVLLTRTAVKDNAGEIIGSSVIVKDITKIKGMERQLMRAEHFTMLGELAASLAHEIKNPLSGIKGAVEVLRDEMPDRDPHKGIMQDVLFEVGRIDKAVRDLLSYAKPKEPEFGPVDLGSLLRRVVSLIQKPLKAKNIEIEIAIDRDLDPIWADANQIEQLFMNLILNSMQAMERPGLIRVVVNDYKDQGTEVLIHDEGRGISKEIKDKIFQPFFTTKVEGSGLGLAICQRIVTDHGGFIDLKSNPGQGTTARIWLPAAANPSFQGRPTVGSKGHGPTR